MNKVEERIFADLVFRRTFHRLEIVRINDNTIELRSESRIPNAKGELSDCKRLTAKNKITNMSAYVYTYLYGTLKWYNTSYLKPIFMGVNGEMYHFLREHEHASGSMFYAFAKERNGVPKYTKSDFINNILFHSGVDVNNSIARQELIPYLNKNSRMISLVSKSMKECGVETIRYEFLRQLIETHKEQSEISETINMANALYKSWGSNANFTRDYLKTGLQGSFDNEQVLTLKPHWFD